MKRSINTDTAGLAGERIRHEKKTDRSDSHRYGSHPFLYGLVYEQPQFFPVHGPGETEDPDDGDDCFPGDSEHDGQRGFFHDQVIVQHALTPLRPFLSIIYYIIVFYINSIFVSFTNYDNIQRIFY